MEFFEKSIFFPTKDRKRKKLKTRKREKGCLLACSFFFKRKENFSSLSSLFPLSSLFSLSYIEVKIPSNERRRRSLEGKSRSSWTPIAVQSRLHFRERLGERARRWDKLVRFLLCLFVFFIFFFFRDDDVFSFSLSSHARFMSIRRESTR